MEKNIDKNPVRISRWPRIFGVAALAISANYASFSNAGASTKQSPNNEVSAGVQPRLNTDPCNPTLRQYETEEGPSETVIKNMVARLSDGGTVKVSARLLPLNGKTTADVSIKHIPEKGYPIEIEIGGETCFAYTETMPTESFGQVPTEQIAGNFSLSNVPVNDRNIPLQNASVVNGELVGADGLLVGWGMTKTTDQIVPGCNFESCN